MTPNEPTDTTIATALAHAGAQVFAVARTETALAELAGGASNITPEIADATDPTVASGPLDRYDPQALVPTF